MFREDHSRATIEAMKDVTSFSLPCHSCDMKSAQIKAQSYRGAMLLVIAVVVSAVNVLLVIALLRVSQ
jgi:hypothetical protein